MTISTLVRPVPTPTGRRNKHAMKCVFARLAIAGACLLFLAVAAACGGSEEETPLFTPTIPATTPSPSAPDPLPTVDATVPLVEYSPPLGEYTVGYPRGWEVVEKATGGDLAVFGWTVDGRPMAQLSTLCTREEDLTVGGLIERDTAVIADFGGGPVSDPVSIEVAGTTGSQVTYRHGVGGLTIEQVVAYAVTEQCGWRIGLATYGGGSLESYLPLFERIIASFQVD